MKAPASHLVRLTFFHSVRRLFSNVGEKVLPIQNHVGDFAFVERGHGIKDGIPSRDGLPRPLQDAAIGIGLILGRPTVSRMQGPICNLTVQSHPILVKISLFLLVLHVGSVRVWMYQIRILVLQSLHQTIQAPPSFSRAVRVLCISCSLVDVELEDGGCA